MRYEIVTSAWRSLFYDALESSDFGFPSQMEKTVAQAFIIADTFLQNEERVVSGEIENFSNRALSDASADFSSPTSSQATDAAGEHLRVTEQYLIDELKLQVRRDIALLKTSIQRVSLEVTLSAKASGKSERSALFEYRFGNSEDVKFMFTDRAGRNLSSRKYVRSLWRSTLLSAYNETTLFVIADQGQEVAIVVHDDPKSEYDGLKVSIGSNTANPSYAEVRAAVFHPNSNAHLEVEKTNVSA